MPVRPRADNPLISAFFPRADSRWRMSVATLASVVMSWPLILHGTPDVESYSMSIFSTVAFVRNLVAGTDPWFVPGYGFGIPLPNSHWLIKFPPALPAALLGTDVLYAVVWLGGGFLFTLFFLRLCGELTRHRGVATVLLLTALLSFSNLGSTYVNDWPAHFLGWALLPACLWSMLRTLTSETARQAIRRGAACCVVLGIFVGSSHHNEMFTFFSGMAVLLALFIRKRPLGVLAAGIAMVVAVISALDVVVPTIQGLRGGGLNPLVAPIEGTPDTLSVRSYGIFLEPARAVATGGLDRALAPGYERVPFFGVVGLALALIGAVYPFRTRDPVNRMPNDVARGIAMGFMVFSALTLLPGWIVLNLPRMWMYRDGQTVFGLLCAAMVLPRLLERYPGVLRTALVVHVLQISLVAAPLVLRVVQGGNDRLYGYARQKHVLFDGLRAAGVNGQGRVVLAGRLEGAVRSDLAVSGITAGTDFPLEGLSLVNARYRGAMTPMLGSASSRGRFGTYRTRIAWNENLRTLTPAGLDVLGITHVALFEDEAEEIDLAGLTPVLDIELSDGQVVRVLRNPDAWSRAVLLSPGEVAAPPPRWPACHWIPEVYCLDYSTLSQKLRARLAVDASGSSIYAILPSNHPGGTLFVSAAVGPTRSATVDGQPQEVRLFMDTFALIEIEPGDRTVRISMRRTDRMWLTVMGVALLGACLVLAVVPFRRRPA